MPVRSSTAREGIAAEHCCTEFTTAHGLDASDDDDVFGAAICPKCENPNPLTGTPATFREKMMRCMGCTHVMVLDGAALAAFEPEIAADVATETDRRDR